MSKILVGDVEIQSVTDADGPFMKLALLFPDVKPTQWLPYRSEHPESFIDPETPHIHFGSYLVRSKGETILIDTGIGANPAPLFGGLQGNLLNALAALELELEQVDTVVLTHLHPDHVGWNLTAEGTPTFPNARYVVHQSDWEAFHLPEVQAAFPFKFVEEMISPLERAGVLDLVSGETPITEEVTVVPAPGHTPGHICVRVSSGGQQAIILGDSMAHPAQVTEPEWRFLFDMDHETAVATRKRLLNRMELEGITGVQCHFPKPGFGLVVRTLGRRHWQPLEHEKE